MKKTILISVLTGTAMLGLAAPLMQSFGEVSDGNGRDAPALAASRGAPGNPFARARLTLQCWQDGVKIVEERNLRGMSLDTLLEENVVSFGRDDEANGGVLVISFADATCLVKTEK